MFSCSAKSSMRFSGISDFTRTSSSTKISCSAPPSFSAASIAFRPFIAIHGQCAQLRQVAPAPAVGASISSFSGTSCCILKKMPLSVATIRRCCESSFAALISWLVELPHRLALLRLLVTLGEPG